MLFGCKKCAENIVRMEIYYYLCNAFAAVAQLAEHQLPKLRVASSSLVCRSFNEHVSYV